MQNDDLIVRVTPQKGRCTYLVRWDAQGHILNATCSRVPEVPAVDRPLQEQIEESVGVVHWGRVIMAGPLEISLDPGGTITSLELRTNPTQWVRAAIPEDSRELAEAAVEFLTQFDSNGLAHVLVPVTVIWDQPHSRLSLLLGDAHRVDRWYRLGTNTAIGLTKDSALREIRFSGIDLTAI